MMEGTENKGENLKESRILIGFKLENFWMIKDMGYVLSSRALA